MFKAKSIVSKLADYFAKNEGSNLSKFIQVFSPELEEIQETSHTVRTWRDIEKAEGRTLDNIGLEVGQPRGSANDRAYRILIRGKIARNLSDGTMDSIINAIATMLADSPDKIKIIEKWLDEYEPEPATLKAIIMPIQNVIDAGLSTEEFAAIVQSTVASGIKIETIELEGTFELGDALAADNTDYEKGLGDINDPSVGGGLSAAFRPNAF